MSLYSKQGLRDRVTVGMIRGRVGRQRLPEFLTRNVDEQCTAAVRGMGWKRTERTDSSMASSASLLQRLLRLPWNAEPPRWNGERPWKAAPLLRALRNMLPANEPHGDSPFGGDLQICACRFLTTKDNER